uniref:Phlebovirus glycoprotein G2 fusion domain-containing protein n=1 Tax=Strongyloides venezuelensis TaxID=75913 RepID=A0A0K0FGZ5_STRVS
MNQLLILFFSIFVIFNLIDGFATERDGKVVVRTKRQQCVCVYISAQQSQIQCSCDQNNSNSNGIIDKSSQVVQQQELQNELQQIQPFSSSKCGCVLIVLKSASYGGQSPQYQCSCSPESTKQTVETTQLPTTTTTTLRTTSIPSIPSKNSVIGAISKDGVTNPCRCVKLPSKLSSETTQYQCNCQNKQTIIPEYEIVDNSNIIIEDPIGITKGNEIEVNVPTTTSQPISYSSYSTNEPSITQCIVISIPSQGNTACVCSENYTQCTSSTCCHKRMRSMRPFTVEGSGQVSKTETAVDLLMDVLKKIKTTL